MTLDDFVKKLGKGLKIITKPFIYIVDILVQGWNNPPALITGTARTIYEAKESKDLKKEVKKQTQRIDNLEEYIHLEVQRSREKGYDFEGRYSALNDKVIELFVKINAQQEPDKETIDSLFEFQKQNRVLIFPTFFPEELKERLSDPLYGIDPVDLDEKYKFNDKKVSIIGDRRGETVVYPIDLGHLALLLKEINKQREKKILIPGSIGEIQSDILIDGKTLEEFIEKESKKPQIEIFRTTDLEEYSVHSVETETKELEVPESYNSSKKIDDLKKKEKKKIPLDMRVAELVLYVMIGGSALSSLIYYIFSDKSPEKPNKPNIEVIAENGGAYTTINGQRILEKDYKTIEIICDKYLDNKTPEKLLEEEKIRIVDGRIHALDLFYTPVQDISPLQNLTQIQELELSATKVQDITALENLTQLQILGLGSTEVKDITALQNLTQLQRLYLNKTYVIDFTPLKKLTQLTFLSMYDCGLLTTESKKYLNELKNRGVIISGFKD